MEDEIDYVYVSCFGALSPDEERMLAEVQATVGQSNAMTGGPTAVDIVFTLSPAVLAALTTIIVRLSKDRRRIRIKGPGFEVDGVDAETAEKIVARLMDRLDSKKEGSKR